MMADLSRVGKPPNLAAVFRRAREVAGLKQEDVVAAVPGLTQSTYSRFELGQANLDVTEIFKIKAFLDGRERKRAGGLLTLASLARADSSWLSPGVSTKPKGKLTEEIAKELEEEHAHIEAQELDRQLDEELPALREKVSELARLLGEALERNKTQEADIAALRAQLQKPSAKPKAVGKKKR
jgi:transcriptional regulator with XRE-family HTH domain